MRLLPRDRQSQIVRVFLESDGLSEAAVLAKLPYDRARSADAGAVPNPKRYRDARQLLRTIGLVYEDRTESGSVLRVTELGHACRRWMEMLNEENCPVLGRHAAFALAACQLRTPTREGRAYHEEVFPFRAIWQFMLALGDRINSDELNRVVLKIESHNDIAAAVSRILEYRRTGDLNVMGSETVVGKARNDRIIVWMSWASFGWMLIHDKDSSGYYRIRKNCRAILMEAAKARFPHLEFSKESEYVKHISGRAALPPDLR